MIDATTPPSTDTLLVACLCAEWCRTCDAYRDTLVAVRDALHAARPREAMRFMWIDIEDESELVGDLDIDDFPTILIARGEQVLFFGPVMPHAATLERLVQNTIDIAATPAEKFNADVCALPLRFVSHAAL